MLVRVSAEIARFFVFFFSELFCLFFHIGLFDAVFYFFYFLFFEENSDNTLTLLVVAEKCLCRVKDFSASCAALSVRMLGVHKELGGYTDRMADSK